MCDPGAKKVVFRYLFIWKDTIYLKHWPSCCLSSIKTALKSYWMNEKSGAFYGFEIVAIKKRGAKNGNQKTWCTAIRSAVHIERDVIVLKASCWTRLSTRGVVLYCLLQSFGNSCGKTVVIVYVLDEHAFVNAILARANNMCYVWSLVASSSIRGVWARHLRWIRVPKVECAFSWQNEKWTDTENGAGARSKSVTHIFTELKNHRLKLLKMQ